MVAGMACTATAISYDRTNVSVINLVAECRWCCIQETSSGTQNSQYVRLCALGLKELGKDKSGL